MNKYKVAIGSDHAGFLTKSNLIRHLKSSGHKVVDCGTHSEDSCDYPDYALRVSREVSSKRCHKGILVCGSGIGMAIAANKVKGIRAGTCWNVKSAVLSSQHNWTNVLCLPARFTNSTNLRKMAKVWLNTSPDAGERHARRVKKVIKIESKRSR